MFDTTLNRESLAYPLDGAHSRGGLELHESVAPSGREAAPAVWHWLAAALDELDYGIVLLCNGMRVVYLNDAARSELDQDHALRLLGGELRAKLTRDTAPLCQAIADAASRGLRRLLTLGQEGDRASISVIPLATPDVRSRAVLVVLGKRNVCESLSALGFARSHQLTSAETRVFVALCSGVSPALVAQQSGVALSTIRTQIGSIRAKTGAESIRALVRQVAVLPPVKSVLLRKRAIDRCTPLSFVREERSTLV